MPVISSEQTSRCKQICARPAECVEQCGKYDLKGIFMRYIGQLILVKRMDGMMQNGLMLNHITAQFDVPERVRIVVG